MKLSVIIPAHNEEESIESTVRDITRELEKASIRHEIIVLNDNSTDDTLSILKKLAGELATLKVINRKPPNGFGRAVREGLDSFSGDVVTIVMGDASDDPRDIVSYFRKIEEGYDCVFGSRFIKGSVVKGYPTHKLIVNRIANTFVSGLFFIRYNDTTNAFKAYRREVIESIKPIQAIHFNITVELPLKAMARGYSYAIIPINWYGRTSGISKLKIREMGRKYLFTVLYVWLEKLLLKDDIRARAGRTK
ncbi:MAG: glycosyltransferase family 2 protein [Thermodesulfobacteriota bacterium]